MDGWMDGWMLGKCCLFGVSDLFLTFPGVFFNFKKISTGSQTRNNFSDRQSNIITSAPNTSTSGATSSSSSSRRRRRSRSSNSSNSNSRSSNDKSWGGWMDGWMDGMLGKCCLFGVFWPVSDLFLTCFQLELAWMSFWPENICADSARGSAESARPCQLLAWFWSRKK